MTDDDTVDHVSRRSILRTSAVATGTLVGGGAGIGTVAGTTQEGETFLELFAGPDRGAFIIARGDALGFDDESIPSDWPWLPDATISGPEGILAFIPERLAAEDGEVGPEQMLVMTSSRTLDGGLTTEATGALVPGSGWFPGSRWVPGNEWFPRELFVAEDGVEGMRVFAIPGTDWMPGNEWFPGSKWFPGSQWEPGRPPWWESQESVEAGESLAGLADEALLLFGAAGSTFFGDAAMPPQDWGDYLPEQEMATVVEL